MVLKLGKLMRSERKSISIQSMKRKCEKREDNLNGKKIMKITCRKLEKSEKIRRKEEESAEYFEIAGL